LTTEPGAAQDARVDRSLAFAAALGTLLGVSWLVFGPTGFLLSGVVVPVALVTYLITARWTEMGVLLLVNGIIPLPFLTLPAPLVADFEATTWRFETVSFSAAGVALASAMIFILLGAAVLLVTGIGSRRSAQRARRLAAQKRLRRG
jgi:hypothetical protein